MLGAAFGFAVRWLVPIGQAIRFGWQYRSDLWDLGKSTYNLYQTLARKKDKADRDEKINAAVPGKNPDALEQSFRTGGSGA